MSNELDDRVHLLKTIADATRLRILGLLADRPHSGRELADALGLSAATVSHHMHRLEGVGIVTATPDATRRVYTLNDGLLSHVRGSSPAAALSGIEDADHQRTVRIFFDGPRLRQIPAKRKARVSVLLELLRRFEAGRDYSEPEVNAILREAHDDVATLRRDAPRGVMLWSLELVPRLFVRFVALCLYRWEIILRESAVMGILGVMTLGFYIDSAVAELRLDRALVLLVVAGAVTAGADALSTAIRSRLGAAGRITTREDCA